MRYTTLELAQSTGGGIRALQGTIRTDGDGASALSIESSDGVTFTVVLRSGGGVYHCSPTGVARVAEQPAPMARVKR